MTTLFNVNKIRSLRDLNLGDLHPDILEVKNYLHNFGYLADDADMHDATLNSQTQLALSRFQQQMGLDITGNFDSATREKMIMPRCGMPDLLDPLGATTVGPWTRRNLTFSFGSLTTQLGSTSVKSAVRSAFSTWEQVNVGLHFSEVGPGDSPDIFVEWRPANDPDRSMVGSLVAHADFPPGFSLIVQSLPLPLHFDDEEHKWVLGTTVGKFDIETIALHEIGHCIGLTHSSTDTAVMYATVLPNRILRSLQDDDIQRIRGLYQ